MRPLEIVLWAVTTSLLLWSLSHRGAPSWVRVLPAVTLAVLLAHVVVEGVRLHLGPAYLVALYLFAAFTWPQVRALQPGVWLAMTGLGLLVTAATLATLLPVFQLPKPTGPHPVGTVALHLVDPDRHEPRTDRADGRRELMVQVWYPAECDGPGEPYRTFAETTLKTQHLARVRTHAALGVPVAKTPARHPVVLFSPSIGGRRNHNVVQAEELASHGFVVVGIDHPFDTDLVVFADGRVVRAGVNPGDEERLRIRVADARFVLDEIERRGRADSTGLLTGRLDTSRVGIFGHSFGGAVAAEMCLTDSRVTAGIDLDGSIYGEAAKRGFGKPFLVFLEDVPEPTPEEIVKATGPAREALIDLADDFGKIRRGLAKQHGQWITVRGTRHVNYCDTPMYSPLWRYRRAGPIRPERAAEVVNAYLVSFFRKHLKGEDDGLFERTPPPYPEAEIERITNGHQ